MEDDEDDFASKEHNILVELFQALWYVVLSHTDFICYAMVFLNQASKSSKALKAFLNICIINRSTPQAFCRFHFP